MVINMEFKHLEIFIKLVETKSFSQAAKLLNFSQPTVSLVIKQLEEELDTPLLIRTTRDLTVTEEGMYLYHQAKDLLKNRDLVVEKFMNRGKNVINFGVSTIPAGYIMPQFVMPFKEQHPEIAIKISEFNSEQVIEKVSKNELSIGMVGMKNGDENCEFYPIYNDDLVFITPNTSYYKDLVTNDLEIRDALKEPIILRELGSGTMENFMNVLDQAELRLSDLNTIATINNLELIIKLVSEGMGTSFVSEISARSMENQGKVLTYRFKNIEAGRDFYLIWNKNITTPSYIQEFIDYVKSNKGEIN